MGEQEQGAAGRSLPQAVFWGFRYAVLLLVIGILLMAVLYVAGMDWTGHMQTVYDYLCYAGVVLGAFLTGHRLKTRGWLGGIILALAYGLFLLILAKIFGQAISFKISAVKMIILVLLGLVGGILGVNL
ncbi:MAG: TIGR04086 family membrane protein [Clostridia bacterium]|mgnify:CR=1 FL=1|nr:TIGR04086 family membrane protein [Clostridia bacterium]